MDNASPSDSVPQTLGVEEELEADKKRPILLLLVGAPGSGKTTFCTTIISAAARSWDRVCQDTIANGKSGTKIQCLRAAADALKDGKSVLIDRCNLEREQRAEFVKLGEKRADVHAVVLDLPARVCISRSVKRTGHEGNLQGGKAAVVVNRMLHKKELPKLSEGFLRITFCQNDEDVRDAIKTYSALGPSDTLFPGEFGQKSKEAVQVGIMKFLKKVDTSSCEKSSGTNVMSVQGQPESSIFGVECCETDPCPMDVETKYVDKKAEDHSISDNSAEAGACTLAFPSISTADFQFDLEKASDIIVEMAAIFLEKVNNVRLVLVDLSHKSKILSLVRDKIARREVDSSKFFTFVGDITHLYSKGRLRCNVIANAANWRLRPGGGGINASIFNAAGEALVVATKERAETLSPGTSVAVPLPPASPLYQREGVTYVIHVLGPNMNPQRPNCLHNDYSKGCNVLRNAYSSLFENFAMIVESHTKIQGRQGTTKSTSTGEQKVKREISHDSERIKKHKMFSANSSSNYQKNPDNWEEKKSAEASKRTWGSWALALYDIAVRPEKHKNTVLEVSNEYVVLNDLYPKAKKHILVLSRFLGLDCLADATKEHLPLLRRMHSAGMKWVQKFLSEDAALTFRLGYHSVPSMRQLHLHVISQDFDSAHLKNNKHWNSFNTKFFRDSVDVIEEIDRYGAAKIDDEKLMSMELRCHRCKSAHPNIPKLKSHIANCRASSNLQNPHLLSVATMTTDEPP